MKEHSDSDLVFYLQMYHDIDLAKWCLDNIRRHYPDSRLMLVSDGDPNPEYPVMAESFGAGSAAIWREQRWIDGRQNDRLVYAATS